MPDLQNMNTVYFLGIGGIGMSAIARYFMYRNVAVYGYDKTETLLTRQLQAEGMTIHYSDSPELIPVDTGLVIYTPAIPETLGEMKYVRSKSFPLMKRAEVLGLISKDFITVAIAGTHGKTTTTTLTSHLLKQSRLDCTAFLGGISKNYDTNLLLSGGDFLVAEADEFDRSFIHLHPRVAVITSMDADHLDIYRSHDELLHAFGQFAGNIREGGTLILKKGLHLDSEPGPNIRIFSYSITEDADFSAKNIKLQDGLYHFDFVYPGGVIEGLTLGLPGMFNVENAVAAMAASWVCGLTGEELKSGLLSFKGVKRRFDIRVWNDKVVYIDDYAHHPAELEACISSVKLMFGNRKLTGIFQPHLYSRTSDFADDFAKSLDLLDEVILLPIYPARELPIPGVSSAWLLQKISKPSKVLLPMQEVIQYLHDHPFEILLTMGAGDIENLAEPIEKLITSNLSAS